MQTTQPKAGPMESGQRLQGAYGVLSFRRLDILPLSAFRSCFTDDDDSNRARRVLLSQRSFIYHYMFNILL